MPMTGVGMAGLYGRRAARATRTPGLQRGESPGWSAAKSGESAVKLLAADRVENLGGYQVGGKYEVCAGERFRRRCGWSGIERMFIPGPCRVATRAPTKGIRPIIEGERHAEVQRGHQENGKGEHRFSAGDSDQRA